MLEITFFKFVLFFARSRIFTLRLESTNSLEVEEIAAG